MTKKNVVVANFKSHVEATPVGTSSGFTMRLLGEGTCQQYQNQYQSYSDLYRPEHAERHGFSLWICQIGPKTGSSGAISTLARSCCKSHQLIYRLLKRFINLTLSDFHVFCDKLSKISRISSLGDLIPFVNNLGIADCNTCRKSSRPG